MDRVDRDGLVLVGRGEFAQGQLHATQLGDVAGADQGGEVCIGAGVRVGLGDQRITAVTLRRPKSGELRGIDLAALVNSADYGALETLLPRISSPTLTRTDVANLDPSDLVQFAAAVVLFFVPRTAAASLSLIA